MQGYPNLEYIVIDGGSTDNSVEIIKKYADDIDYWVSESDSGQANAINKGLVRASGSILNWVNSDDFLMPGALFEIARSWSEGVDLVVGAGAVLAQDGITRLDLISPNRIECPLDTFQFSKSRRLFQPSIFFSRDAFHDAGSFREDLNFVFDWEWYLRLTLIKRGKLRTRTTRHIVASYHAHPQAKTQKYGMKSYLEGAAVLRQCRNALLEGEMRVINRRRRIYLARHRLMRMCAGPGNAAHGLIRQVLKSPGVLLHLWSWKCLARSLMKVGNARPLR